MTSPDISATHPVTQDPFSPPAATEEPASKKDSEAAKKKPTTRPERLAAKFDSMTDAEYREALVDNLFEEDPDETAAFYSEKLVERTYVQADFLLKDVNGQLKRLEGESSKERERRARHFQTLVGTARLRALRTIDGLRAQRGEGAWNAPNPRARAARELQRLHPEEYVQLVRKHQAAIDEEEAAKKAARAAASKARKRRRRQSR